MIFENENTPVHRYITNTCNNLLLGSGRFHVQTFGKEKKTMAINCNACDIADKPSNKYANVNGVFSWP